MPYKDKEKRKEFARNWMKKKRSTDPDFKTRSKVASLKWIENNREKYLEKKKEWRKKQGCSYWESQNDGVKRRRIVARKKVVEYYGGKCSCCGEKEYDFLTIDHVNGGGTKHRKIVSSALLPSLIIKNNYPDDYQILCYNCNCSKAFNKDKVCPHKVKNISTIN
jgi:hypothetical protein